MDHQFHQKQQHNHLNQHRQSKPQFNCHLYPVDGQIVNYLNATNTVDQSQQHSPYVPPFHVDRFPPNPIHNIEGSGEGCDLQWNNGLEPKKKRLKELDFLERNAGLSSCELLQPRPVSTGLGLSLSNGYIASSSRGSSLLSFIGDDIDQELWRHDAEIDTFLKVQGDRFKQGIMEMVQAYQLETMSNLQEKVLRKIREKEAEVDRINMKNIALEEQLEKLSMEASAWQQRAQYNENMIATLNYNLQQVHAQTRDSKEGCGDSEADDAASCCNGAGALDFQLLSKENGELKQLMSCRACQVNQACMLLLPCKHLCLCKGCESKLSFCPLCQSSKFVGVEVCIIVMMYSYVILEKGLWCNLYGF